jgi:hypothetical protein
MFPDVHFRSKYKGFFPLNFPKLTKPGCFFIFQQKLIYIIINVWMIIQHCFQFKKVKSSIRRSENRNKLLLFLKVKDYGFPVLEQLVLTNVQKSAKIRTSKSA